MSSPRARSFSFDLPLDDPRDPPTAGDLLVTARLIYRITAARPVDSKVWGNRWRLTVVRLQGRDERPWPDVEVGTACWFSQAYAKGETPSSAFGAPWPPPTA